MPPKWKSGRSALASAAGAAKAAEIADKARARLFKATMVGLVTEWRKSVYSSFLFSSFFLAQVRVCVQEVYVYREIKQSGSARHLWS